ncbi:MAG: hypothetical protein ACJAS9_004047, partial [Polaribacter sp.]
MQSIRQLILPILRLSISYVLAQELNREDLPSNEYMSIELNTGAVINYHATAYNYNEEST